MQEIHSFMLAVHSVPSKRISAHYLVNLPPFRNSYPGSHGTHSSPFPTTVRAFVLIARKINVQNQVSFPGVRLRRTGVHSCNLLVWYAARRLRDAFCGQLIYWCFFFRLTSLDPNEHTSYLQIIYSWCIFTCSIIAIYPESILDVDIDISRKYFMIYLEF